MTEMTTGLVADTSNHLRGDHSSLAGIETALSRLNGYKTAASETAIYAGAVQTSLGLIHETAEHISQTLLTTSNIISPLQLSSAVAAGAYGFETAVSALNTRVGDRAVFAGTNSSFSPLPDAKTILTALEAAVSSATTAEDAAVAIKNWFNGSAGYEMLYTGGLERAGVPIGPGETADLTVTALDPVIRETLSGLAMVALLDRDFFGSDHASRSALAAQATGLLVSNADDRALLAGRVGVVEQQIADAQVRNAAERSAMEISRLSLIEADPIETAARLEDLQNRLDAFYTLTSRFSRLRLSDYL